MRSNFSHDGSNGTKANCRPNNITDHCILATTTARAIAEMRELLAKKNHELDSKGGDEDASKVSKNYNRASFDYDGSSKNPTLPMINPGKPPPFDGVRCTDWAHTMKLHLIVARCWEVVDVGVDMPQKSK